MIEQRAVVIVGSGPAAAGAVRSLRRGGCSDILVLDREAETGGVPRHCGHTGYGVYEFHRVLTGPDYAKRLAAELSVAAIVRTHHTVRRINPGGVVTVTGPTGSYSIQAQAILLAVGARETPRAARLAGGVRAAGIMSTGALQQFVYLEHRRPARRIVVIGTELVSFSTLLTCREAGIEVAALIEQGERPIARRPADLIARHVFGVPVEFGATVLSVEGDDRVTGVIISQNGESRRIACDGVVFSGQFVPESTLVRSGGLALDAGSGGPQIDEFWRTSDPAVFAAGNVVHPIETAGECFRDGEGAGRAIALHLASRLPAVATQRIVPAGAMRYVYPQRCTASPGRLLGRAHRAWQGTMRITLDGRVVEERRIDALPERRLRIPVAPFAVPFRTAEVALV